jgi:predicted nucleic acid-binding protein
VFLLDTNVVSELRRARPHGAVVAWLRDVPNTQLHVSAVTRGELQAGVEITRERDPEQAGEIEIWIAKAIDTFNVLPMDGAAFRRWAQLMHRRANSLNEDAMIAATAEMHGPVVVTRNVRDFEQFGVATFDPFSAAKTR